MKGSPELIPRFELAVTSARVSRGVGYGGVAADGDYGDVVGLAKLLRRAGDFSGGPRGKIAGAVEAEQLALLVLRFDDAISAEGQAAALGEVIRGLQRVLAVGTARRRASSAGGAWFCDEGQSSGSCFA